MLGHSARMSSEMLNGFSEMCGCNVDCIAKFHLIVRRCGRCLALSQICNVIIDRSTFGGRDM